MTKSALTHPPPPLQGRVAVVTGAFGNLGPIWTTALRQAGAQVVGLDRDVPPDGAHGDDGFFRVDVTDADALRTVAEAVGEQYGTPHVLVNSAGIDQPPTAGSGGGGIEDVRLSDVVRVLETNAGGVFATTQAFGPAMAQAGQGSIVNVGSLYASIAPDPGFYDHMEPPFLKPAAYGASKAAVVNLTKYFARLWGPSGVRVNAISPGGVLGNQDPEFQRKFIARTPLRRFATEADLGPALVFLASDDAAYITGQELRLDGGFTA